MGNVIADMSMSLDGFSTGPNDGPQSPMGEGVIGSTSGWPVWGTGVSAATSPAPTPRSFAHPAGTSAPR
jgi:hypothetical protein